MKNDEDLQSDLQHKKENYEDKFKSVADMLNCIGFFITMKKFILSFIEVIGT